MDHHRPRRHSTVEALGLRPHPSSASVAPLQLLLLPHLVVAQALLHLCLAVLQRPLLLTMQARLLAQTQPTLEDRSVSSSEETLLLHRSTIRSPQAMMEVTQLLPHHQLLEACSALGPPPHLLEVPIRSNLEVQATPHRPQPLEQAVITMLLLLEGRPDLQERQGSASQEPRQRKTRHQHLDPTRTATFNRLLVVQPPGPVSLLFFHIGKS